MLEQQPHHLPHLARPDILHMGLEPITAEQWIEPHAEPGSWVEHKRIQRARLGARAYRAAPESLAAQQELAELLLAHLTATDGDSYRLRPDGLQLPSGGPVLPLPGEEPLWDASLWIADDLILMQALDDGAYRLTAASLCSPSDWLLEEKFGAPIAAIHAPIPGFADTLNTKVDRFLTHLRPEHPVQRFNWSLQSGGALCARPGDEPSGTDAALHYRCERQTLRRLPGCGAVAFTIRVHLCPLTALRAVPGALEGLLSAVDSTPPALARYKGFDQLAPMIDQFRPVQKGTV